MTDNFPDELSFPRERYEPIERIGAGTAGSVFKCLDKVLKKTVAVKILNNLTESQIVDFQREAWALSSLQHTTIVSVFDFGISKNGSPYLVMEYIDGETLAQLLEREGPLQTSDALKIFLQVADALEHAHGKGIFHRDIKPTNILILRDQQNVKLIDFGIAAMLATHTENAAAQGQTIVGTPMYMSPDQVKGEEYTAASESYSLCCMLFETLVGTPPFQGDSPLELFSKHANQPAPSLLEFNTPSIIFPRLDEVVRVKGLAKDRAKRFTSMNELAEALNILIEESRTLEFDRITYGAWDETRPAEKHIEQELKDVNMRYTIGFIVCLLAVVAVIPVITLMIYNQNDSKRSVDNQNSSKKKKKKHKETNNLESVVRAFDMDNTNILGEDCHLSGAIDAKDFAEKIKGKKLSTASLIAVELTPEAAKVIAGLPLRKLTIQNTTVTDEIAEILCKMQTLSHLQIRYAVLSDQAMQSLSKLHSLTMLDLDASSFSDRGLQYFANHRLLKKLLIQSTQPVSSDGLKTGFNGLEELRLAGSTINGRDLSFLKRMKSLTELDLAPFDITDAETSQLLDLPLTALKIASDSISNATVARLAKMPNLVKLEVDTMGKVTELGINQVAAENPSVRVLFMKSPPAPPRMKKQPELNH